MKNSKALSFELSLLVTGLAVLVGLNLLTYFAGYRIWAHFSLFSLYCKFFSVFLILFCFWRAAKNLARMQKAASIVCIIFLVIAIAGCIWDWSQPDLFFEGFRARMHKDVNPLELQKWAAGQMPEKHSGPDEMAVPVVKLPPPFVANGVSRFGCETRSWLFQDSQNGGYFIEIYFVDGCSLMVGAKGFEIPGTDMLGPGVFVVQRMHK